MKNVKPPFSLIIILVSFSLLTIFSCKKDVEEIVVQEEVEELMTCLAEIDGTFQEVTLDENPEYLDGGFEGFISNMFDFIAYPSDARENGIQGITSVNYEITEEGKVENIEIVENPGGGIGEELQTAIEEVTTGVSYSPGILVGSPIRVKKKISLTFKLQG